VLVGSGTILIAAWMLRRERKKTYPNIPKTLEEYDSSQGATVLDSGGNDKYEFIKSDFFNVFKLKKKKIFSYLNRPFGLLDLEQKRA